MKALLHEKTKNMIAISSTLTLLIIIARIAFFTLLERKILSYSQIRKGPNKPRFIGVPQPARDGVKLFTKESTKLTNANKIIFIASPLIAIALAFILWLLPPTSASPYWFRFPVVLFLCVSRLTVYAIIAAGWSSNAKFSLLGALRRIAQTISYEVRIALILITALLIIKSLKLLLSSSSSFIFNIWLTLPPLALIWYRTTLAETNRSPYDLAEGERELVSGFNTEYRGPEFALIFIAEYMNIIFISALTRIIFLQQATPWTLSQLLKTIILATLFISSRASFPRLRYDRLIIITWTSYLPTTLIIILILRGV